MLSRQDTLQWLGDDDTSLCGKAADILKLDVSVAASPSTNTSSTASIQSSDSHDKAEALIHPEVAVSDSFSCASEQGGLSRDSEAQRPTVDVDVVTDAVGKLTVVSDAEPATSVASAELSDNAAVASKGVAMACDNAAVHTDDAATADDSAAVAGAVGGRSNDSLLSMLAQFADETVC